MEKFMIDLDKVLNDFEFNEDCAEQIASVATSTIDASTVEKRASESVPPKMYSFSPERAVTIDVVPPVEKYRDVRPTDVDSKYTLAEKNIVFISDAYGDISQSPMQKQQSAASDSTDGDRYDKKLNQPNFKPSISNVFNSLNEYINAPTGSLSYVEPMLEEVDDLSNRSADDAAERDFRSSRDVAINERSVPIEKGTTNVADTTVEITKMILPVELGTFGNVETSGKQDNAKQNVMFYHFSPIQPEENSGAVIPVSNTAISQIHNNVTIDARLSSNKDDVDKKVTASDAFKEKSDSIVSEQRQSDLDGRDPVDEYALENKESTAEAAAKLDKTAMSSESHDTGVGAAKCSVFSSVRMTHTTDTSDDFSEEELNQYLLELEKEESSKTENVPLSDNAWPSQPRGESRGDGEKSAGHCQRDDENVNEAPIFEKIMIGELPKIVPQEEFQERTKKFPVIDYNADACNEAVTDVKCINTVRDALNEKSDQLRDVRSNELDETTRDTHLIEAVGQDVATQESTLQAAPGVAVVQERVASKFESLGEQVCDNDTTQRLHQDSNRDAPPQENSSGISLSSSENKEEPDKVHCQDTTESNRNAVREAGACDSEEISKMETVSKVSDACVVPHTREDDQEAEKPTRPQTLDIVLTHNKNDSHSESSSVVQEPEHPAEISGTVDEDRGASDVSDNSLGEWNIVLGKQPPFWIPDSDASSCMLCDAKFTVLKRRHHCRACGKVLCNKCCNMKYRLEYQVHVDSRVCAPCYHLLTKAESEQGMGDWSAGYNSYTDCSDVNSVQGRQPNPNNPMEYCSTIPPLQQLAGGMPPPPTVMVPVGVLKREGSKHRAEGQKSVMFSDGIRPGCDLTELDTCWDPKPPYRKPGNKRIFPSGSALTDTVTRRQHHPPLDNTTNSYIPHDPNLLPPTVTIHKGQITYHPPMDEDVLYKTLKNECEPSVMFAINRNLYAYVKITNLNCCVNKICWNVTSRGLACIGQDEVILLVEVLPDETRIPKDLLIYINQLYLEAIKGNTMTELGFSVYQGTNLLGSREHAGFLFIRQTLQCLQKIILPPAPFLIGLLVHRWETPWAKVFPLRLLLRLGAEYRYYPCPLVSVRFRNALYFEIGHTVMKVLADFRNFGYTLPGVRGLTIHLKNRTTDVMFPRNRYDQVIKGLHNSNDHVLAYASNFSITADSHLVCIQTNTGDESSYQTQAINIHNKPRTVTGASFIVINGALKSSMGLSAKSSIVEDGLMVEIMPEKMEALKAALKNMQDFSIGCGRQGASEPDETVNIKWVDNDTLFNLGVKSPIDGQLMDGIPSIRVHNGIDYKGATRFIRWTEVFIIKSDDHSSGVNDPVDINKLSGSIAKATCAALVKLLDLLATAGLTKLGVRTTIHPDNVGYEAGSEGTKLPPIYMKSLDNELIQVLHKAVQSSQDAYTVLELIFYVLED
ncbi:PREDICTED: zinc finger FYVE domain-containing protein 9 isoform X2 [Vollenhovia emeryi]|uniref:zinc finger FYVE domain-containing protein 9 isoform X2 n=1 Tax=Vollenhovia emeryi TaxID=411798 RepID=UPI0005F45C52|nr:PREDICTED: zinc finger FYVE domain-containing protein 9 isoform X2 [Vollenhovia emeryi]